MDIYRGIGPLFQRLKTLGDMGFHKMLSIIVIVIIFLYILYNLLQKRNEMIREQFTNSNVLSIQKANKLIPNIQNMSKNYYSKPLNQFYIMSAYGGGFDGYEITEDMILYTLSLGYRYVFIHVFFDNQSTGSTAMVGFSSIYSPMENIAQKTVPLVDFIELLEQNAFSTSSAPNPVDPFFLHILPAYQTGQDTTSKQRAMGHNTQLNSQIEQAISIIQNTNRASGKVEPTTPLRQIQGQLVICMDATSTAGNMTDNLKNMISMNVPSSSIQKSPASASPASPSPSLSTSSPASLSIVLPFDENGTILNSIPPYKDLYNAKKWNITPVCPWESRFVFTVSILGPTNFGDYEKMFYTEGSSAFIPLT